MRTLKCGIIGLGYMGGSHVEAIRRLGFVEPVAVADANYDLARRRAEEYHIPRACRTVDELLADPEIEAVHDCTPNNLHLEVNTRIIEAGKHVFSEKPLARTSEESGRLVALLDRHPEIVAALNFNYRMNPLVQEMKARVAAGEIGRPLLVHGSYLQDWLLYETDYNWRVDPEVSGPSRCVADIGSHWIDAVQTVLGRRIVAVCADLATVHPVRRKPKGRVETFAVNTSVEYDEIPVKTEDYAAVLFEMEGGVRGVFYVSEVSAGRKCFFEFEIDGTGAAMHWNQEIADWMWLGYRDRHNCQVMRNPNLMPSAAKAYAGLAAGHPEGWNDAMRNNVNAFYRFIAERKRLGKDPCDFATFAEGHYIMKIIEAILASGRTRGWVRVQS